MRMHTKYWLIFLAILTVFFSGCCTTEGGGYSLTPDPTPPAFNNTNDTREMMIDILNLKILAARWKLKSIHDRILVGEIPQGEGEEMKADIIAAIKSAEARIEELE